MHDDDFSAARASDDGRMPATSDRQADRRQVVQMPTSRMPATPLATEAAPANDDQIDLRAYWRMLVKRRWLILAVLAAALAFAFIKTALTPAIFRATAVLQIDPTGMQVMQVQGISPMGSSYDPDFNQTQYQLLKSRALAERVAQDLHLPGSDIYQRLQPAGWFQRLRSLLGPSTDRGRAIAKADNAAAAPTAAQLRRATQLVQGGLTIAPIHNSHMVQIEFDSTSAAFSARVANAVANGFIASSMDRQFGASSYARKYLEDQLAQLKARLSASERALVAYAQKENIVPGKAGGSLVGQNLTELNSSLATAQEQRIRAQARWEQARTANDAALPADMLNNSNLRTLQKQLSQLQGQYQDKLQTFKPGYPAMLALKRRIDEVQQQITHELANIRASVKAEYDAAMTQETMLEAQLADLRKQSLQIDSRSIQYNILKRDVDTNRQLYNALLQRYKEVGMAGNAKTSNISVVDAAQIPTSRHSPSMSRNLIVGVLAGLTLGILLALLLEYLDNTLKTPQDIEDHLHLGVLGIIPKLVKQTPFTALKDPRSAFSESYRSTRTALQFSTQQGVPHILLLTSAGPGEGKSTSALTLARDFAQLGRRVLLIEGDMRHPTLGRQLGVASNAGLSSLLAGATTLAQSLTRTDNALLDVILSGPLPPSPTELLSGTKLVSLLTAAGNQYDQVIIDGPPVLGIADAPILANMATGTLLLVRSGSTRIDAANMAIKRLHLTHARMIGCLLTQFDPRQSGYGYNYGGYYAYGSTPRLSAR